MGCTGTINTTDSTWQVALNGLLVEWAIEDGLWHEQGRLHGLWQEIASHVRMNASALAAVRTGQRNLTPRTASRIAGAFGRSLAAFYEELYARHEEALRLQEPNPLQSEIHTGVYRVQMLEHELAALKRGSTWTVATTSPDLLPWSWSGDGESLFEAIVDRGITVQYVLPPGGVDGSVIAGRVQHHLAYGSAHLAENLRFWKLLRLNACTSPAQRAALAAGLRIFEPGPTYRLYLAAHVSYIVLEQADGRCSGFVDVSALPREHSGRPPSALFNLSSNLLATVSSWVREVTVNR